MEKSTLQNIGEFIGGFIPGISEAIDAKDVYQGVKTKNYVQAGLGLLGLALPAVSGAQIKGLVKGASHLIDATKLNKSTQVILDTLSKSDEISDAGKVIKSFSNESKKLFTHLGKAEKEAVVSDLKAIKGGDKILDELTKPLQKLSRKETAPLVQEAIAKHNPSKNVEGAHRMFTDFAVSRSMDKKELIKEAKSILGDGGVEDLTANAPALARGVLSGDPKSIQTLEWIKKIAKGDFEFGKVGTDFAKSDKLVLAPRADVTSASSLQGVLIGTRLAREEAQAAGKTVYRTEFATAVHGGQNSPDVWQDLGKSRRSTDSSYTPDRKYEDAQYGAINPTTSLIYTQLRNASNSVRDGKAVKNLGFQDYVQDKLKRFQWMRSHGIKGLSREQREAYLKGIDRAENEFLNQIDEIMHALIPDYHGQKRLPGREKAIDLDYTEKNSAFLNTTLLPEALNHFSEVKGQIHPQASKQIMNALKRINRMLREYNTGMIQEFSFLVPREHAVLDYAGHIWKPEEAIGHYVHMKTHNTPKSIVDMLNAELPTWGKHVRLPYIDRLGNLMVTSNDQLAHFVGRHGSPVRVTNIRDNFGGPLVDEYIIPAGMAAMRKQGGILKRV